MKNPRLFRWGIAVAVGSFGVVGCGAAVPEGDAEEEQQAVFNGPDAVASLNALIRQGANLFFNETFAGNGRTCGSCHRADNNLTIDKPFLATLPSNDPVFVAEFVPALAQNFEKPTLMRQLGLILENVDGVNDLPNKFTMRGVPHVLGMPVSMTNPPGSVAPPNQRTGWSGDGAPGGGTLRDFASGAVFQHFTKRTNRVAGTDFRLPTDAELNAMEAFQLFTGRDAELNLTTLSLKPVIASSGQTVFTSAQARCNACHLNAGANASFGGGGNRNFNTGVENFPDPAAQFDSFAASRRDEGFGSAPSPTVPGGFGDGTFNTPSLVEAADTPPFFHNNSVATIEGAVAFYNSAAFNASPSGPAVNLTTTQVNQVGAFLRVINALENIRASKENLNFIRANQSAGAAAQNQDLFTITIADIKDCNEVMAAPGGLISQAADNNFSTARQAAIQAKAQPPGATQRGYIDTALQWLELARKELQN